MGSCTMSSHVHSVAVIEPVSQRTFQFSVLDSCDGLGALAFPEFKSAREEVLGAYLSGFVAPPMTPIASKASASSPATGSASKGAKASRLIHRATRKLPSGQPVLLSVVRELLTDRSLRFRVLMYHPVTARESHLVVAGPFVDRILGDCHLGDSRTATI